MATIRDHRPAVVFTRLGMVQLVTAARAVLNRPELPGLGIDSCSLDISMAIRPNLRARTGAANERARRRSTLYPGYGYPLPANVYRLET